MLDSCNWCGKSPSDGGRIYAVHLGRNTVYLCKSCRTRHAGVTGAKGNMTIVAILILMIAIALLGMVYLYLSGVFYVLAQ